MDKQQLCQEVDSSRMNEHPNSQQLQTSAELKQQLQQQSSSREQLKGESACTDKVARSGDSKRDMSDERVSGNQNKDSNTNDSSASQSVILHKPNHSYNSVIARDLNDVHKHEDSVSLTQTIHDKNVPIENCSKMVNDLENSRKYYVNNGNAEKSGSTEITCLENKENGAVGNSFHKHDILHNSVERISDQNKDILKAERLNGRSENSESCQELNHNQAEANGKLKQKNHDNFTDTEIANGKQEVHESKDELHKISSFKKREDDLNTDTGITGVRCRSGQQKSHDSDSDVIKGCAVNESSSWSEYLHNKKTFLKGCMNARAGKCCAYEPTEVEHIANIITHAAWIVPSIIGLWWMTCISTNRKQEITALIFGMALFFLFSVSAIYYILAYSAQFKAAKNFFHIGDRATIYMFIASSYTPWPVTPGHRREATNHIQSVYWLLLKGFNDWEMIILLVVWFCAILGIFYQYMFHEQYKMLSTILYVIIGVAPAIVILEMEEKQGLYELGLGGASYLVGVIFFKSDGLIPFAHAIWHLFVFMGAAFHYYAICRHLLGSNTAT